MKCSHCTNQEEDATEQVQLSVQAQGQKNSDKSVQQLAAKGFSDSPQTYNQESLISVQKSESPQQKEEKSKLSTNRTSSKHHNYSDTPLTNRDLRTQFTYQPKTEEGTLQQNSTTDVQASNNDDQPLSSGRIAETAQFQSAKIQVSPQREENNNNQENSNVSVSSLNCGQKLVAAAKMAPDLLAADTKEAFKRLIHDPTFIASIIGLGAAFAA